VEAPDRGPLLFLAELIPVFFKFKARTPGGETRTGMVQAESEQSAYAQLQRRGFVHVELSPADPVPAPVAPATPGPTRSPASHPAPPAAPRPPEPHWWRQLDWSRLGPVATGAGVLLVALLFVVSWLMQDKTYTVRVEGELRLQTRRKLSDDYWKRVRLNLWLADSNESVHSDGSVWKRDTNKQWKKQPHTAHYECSLTPSGNYVMEVSLPLPQLPTKCGVVAHAPGFRPRAKQNIALVLKDDKLQAKATSLLLYPRRRKTGDGKKRRSRRRGTPTPAS
jgi:hypothetical protein